MHFTWSIGLGDKPLLENYGLPRSAINIDVFPDPLVTKVSLHSDMCVMNLINSRRTNDQVDTPSLEKQFFINLKAVFAT